MHDASNHLAKARGERFHAMVAELIPKIRRVSPTLTEAQLRSAAELMAEYRLADEELGKNAV
jgi:hypothetical protein